MLNKVILILSLIYSFSYGGAFIQEYNGNEVASFNKIVREDPYNNEGKYYELIGTVFQRIDANSMLVIAVDSLLNGASEKVIYVEGIPKGTSVAEDNSIGLVVKGDGAFKYTTGNGAQKVVVKAIWQEEINKLKK